MDFLLIIIIIIPLLAQLYVKGNYNKYKNEETSSHMSGYDVARKVLDSNGLKDMLIVETNGILSDHYDPSRKVVRLSKDVYNSISISSNAIAAHECGHAIQDKEGYTFLKIRSFLFPLVNIVSRFSYYLIFIGLVFEFFELYYLGIVAASLGIVFQIVTLPVEFNASNRAKEELKKLSISNDRDMDGISSMLYSAALTYVAAMLASLIQLIRLINIRRD